ncbi:hypothetical protein CP965_06570 [Halarcobacter mediterraneus]|uniref:DUF2845 domain-containing protein n=1 Tax=Halarcobacter mediterraneus TaxID=2023153 RepID=A0A4Q1AWL5_9BACT|nr:hypothetical protein [Halarcobacter mediterraneus]RXK13461.1 hypothetical protein CP965_06570 [Halarcobacter mediterraneus]
MKKILLFIALIHSFLFAQDNIINMKKCESVKVSKYTSIVSCHKVDYLIEYRYIDDVEKDSVKKITVITPQKQVIVKDIGNKR